MGILTKPKAATLPVNHTIDTPLLQFGPLKTNKMTCRQAAEGVVVIGETGAGKSSSSGRAIAQSYLKSNMGGVVLTYKNDEVDVWYNYCAEAGRLDDLIIFGPNSPHRFNFMDYSASVSMQKAGRLITHNIVSMLQRMIEVIGSKDQFTGQAPEKPFWRLAPRQLLDHTIDILWAAYGTLRLDDIERFILSAPQKQSEFFDKAFIDRSFCMQSIKKAGEDPVYRLPKQDFDVIQRYWANLWSRLDPKTKTAVEVTMSAQLAPFLKGVMREKFCTFTTIVPEMAHEGAVIVIDFNAADWQDIGIAAQVLFKDLYQRSLESRKINKNSRFCFTWIDEAQNFVVPRDLFHQSVARSARSCSVLLSQAFSSFYATIGGTNPRDATHAFLSQFTTKIFHCQHDSETCLAASELVGKEIEILFSGDDSTSLSNSNEYGESLSFSNGTNFSSSTDNDGNGSSSFGASNDRSEGKNIGQSLSESVSRSHGWSQNRDYVIHPHEWSQLRKGGPENDFCCDAVIYQSGRPFKGTGGKNYMTVAFPQRG